MILKSSDDLKNLLLNKCENALKKVQDKVYRIIDSCLNEFYDEFTPAEYIRTKQLLYSLVKSEVRQINNEVVAEVYFDVSKLNYDQGLVPLKNGGYGWATWDGNTVLDVAMTGSYGGKPHGGYATGTAVWTESMIKIGGRDGIIESLKQALISEGIPIK